MGGKPTPEACARFDAIFLCASELQRILPCSNKVFGVPLEDWKPTRDELKAALLAAKKVRDLRRAGKNVLVTCAMGINRSGFVTALALVMEGVSADDAIKMVRKRRKLPGDAKALSNEHFVELVYRLERARQGVHG